MKITHPLSITSIASAVVAALVFCVLSSSSWAQADEETVPTQLSCSDFLNEISYVSNSEKLLALHTMVMNPSFSIGSCERPFLKIEISKGWEEGYNYDWHIILEEAIQSYEHIETYINDGYEKQFREFTLKTFDLLNQRPERRGERELIPLRAINKSLIMEVFETLPDPLAPLEIFYLDGYHTRELEHKKASKTVMTLFKETDLRMRKKMTKKVMAALIASSKQSVAFGFGEDTLKAQKHLNKALKRSSLLKKF